MARSSAKIDLTNGPIIPLVMRFALPICIGSLLQMLYSTVDTLIVGNFCGAVSLAAVGTSSQPIEMFLCLFTGLGTGVAVLVSQYTGSGDIIRLRRVIRSANFFLYLCAIPLTILGYFFSHYILRLMQTPADTWDLAVSYTQIMFLGTLGNLGYNVNAGILRGVGDSSSTLRFLIISCILNVVLDLLFVAVLGMDAGGAALATIIAQFTSWFTSMAYIRSKYPDLEYVPIPRKVESEGLKELIHIALPLGLNNSIYSVGHMFLQTLINTQGSIFMAACSVGGKINALANVTVQATASAATSFAGQNLGAKRYDRLAKGGWQIPLFTGVVTLSCGIIVTLFSQPLLSLFNSDPAVLEMATLYVQRTILFVWMFAVFNSILNFVNGMGILTYPTIVNVLMLWAVRIPVAYAITAFWDGTYVMISYPISFVFGMSAMLCFYLSKRWKEICQLAKRQLS